jgi:hypothetical protein
VPLQPERGGGDLSCVHGLPSFLVIWKMPHFLGPCLVNPSSQQPPPPYRVEVQDNQSLSACHSQELESLRRSTEQVPITRLRNTLSADMDEDGGMTKDAREIFENPEREVTVTSRTRQLRKSGRPRLDSPGAVVLSSVGKSTQLCGVCKSSDSHWPYTTGSLGTDSTGLENL